MVHDPLPGLTILGVVSATEKAALLSLPNETLLQIIQALAGEPTLSLPRYSSPGNEAIHTIRLVNRRLGVLGSYYVRFRHKCLSERQLEYEANHLTEGEILKRRYTRQLEIAAVPIVHWLSTLQTLYPYVTHLSLDSVRLSATGWDSPESSQSVLPSILHLSIQLGMNDERTLPIFLRAFPNLVTLVLNGDPTRGYYGMDTGLLLSLPPLPNLTTLYRPPLKRNHLMFSNDHGPNYMTQHRHSDFVFNEYCNECNLWKQQAETTEKITITQLHWHFPSLSEVLVPRLVFEDWMSIVGLSSDQSIPALENRARTEGLDLIERMRRRSDVAVWRLEPDNHDDCAVECVWKKRRSPLRLAAVKLQMTIALATMDLRMKAPDEEDSGTPDIPPSERPQFHILSPRDYNEHAICKKGTIPSLVSDSPKFWWTVDDRAGSFLVLRKSIDKTPVGPVPDSRAILFSPWDL